MTSSLSLVMVPHRQVLSWPLETTEVPRGHLRNEALLSPGPENFTHWFMPNINKRIIMVNYWLVNGEFIYGPQWLICGW